MVPDPGAVRDILKGVERGQLASIAELADPRHDAWSVARDPDDARAALARIVEP